MFCPIALLPAAPPMVASVVIVVGICWVIPIIIVSITPTVKVPWTIVGRYVVVIIVIRACIIRAVIIVVVIIILIIIRAVAVIVRIINIR